MAHRTPAPLRTLGAVLRALLGLAVLGAVISLTPWLLLQFGVLHWPGADFLTQPDDGTLFLTALTGIGWLAWAAFTAATLIEVLALAGRRAAPRIKGLGSMQRLVSVLIGGIVLLAPTAASAATAPTAAAAVAAPGPDSARAPAAQRDDAGRDKDDTSGPRHTVASATESPAGLAEKYLGDWQRWKDIAALNPDIPELAAGDHYLPKGTTLKLPADARLAPSKPDAVPAALATNTAVTPSDARTHTGLRQDGDDARPDHVTVQPGDSLWKIAENELDDGTRYREIFEENRGAAQPGGGTLTDPDDIRVGLKLDIPRPAAAPTKPSDEAKPDTAPPPSKDRADTERDSGKGPGSGPAEQDKPSQAPKDKPKDKPEDKQPPASPPATEHPPVPSHPTEQPTEQEKPTDSQDTAVGVREVAGIGMLLAGCLISAVGIKRLLQRRRRSPGETIAMPAEPARLEEVLEASAEPGSIDLLDRALRTLAHHADQQSTPLPAARGARVTSRTVELLIEPDTDADALAPFTATSDGWWTLDETQTLLDADQARETPAPYPGLVTLGTEPDGSHLLLNLPATRVLLLEGDDHEVRDTARALALEAATSSWSDHAEIITIGLGTELPALLPQGRLRAAPHLRAAQGDLGELLLEHHQGGEDGPAPLPWLLICSANAPKDEAQYLADALAAAAGAFPVAVVLPADGACEAFPEALRLAAGRQTPQHLDDLDADLVVQSLPEEDYQDFLEVLRTAQEPARPAEGPWQLVPPGALDTPSEPRPMAPFTGLAAVPEAPFTALTATPDPTTSPSSVPPLAALTPQPTLKTNNDAAFGGSPDDAVGPAGEDLETASPTEVDDPVDLNAPEIQVLGPVAVTGIEASGHGFKLALLAALLHFKADGCTIDTAREAMDPRSPWSKQTLQVRISELRNRLGFDADGNLYLPKTRTGTYRLSRNVRCDWDRFQHLAQRGLSQGPATGTTDLESALALVRGRPLGGADIAWAAARIQEMLVRITDVAHTLATWHRTAPHPDLDAARRAIRIALDVDDSAELLYQDWMLIEDQAANRAGVRTAYETLRDINKRLDVGMEPETERVYDMIMSRSA